MKWLMTIGMLVAVTMSQADVYVAPNGDDRGAGTRLNPFATLARARDALRTEKTDKPRRIVVRGGNYYDVALELDAQDSGLTIQAVQGEKPVLYGGRQIQNWEKDGENYYSAKLPEGGADVRMLQVNGAMRPRARWPVEGSFTHLSSFDVPWMSSTGGGWQRKPSVEELTTLRYKPDDLPASLDTRNAEVTVFHMWDESCVGVASNDVAQHTLTLAPPCGHPPGAFGVKKFVVWNVREGMSSPGQWYHDRARGRIVYWPMAGEDMRHVEVIAPTRIVIVRLRGGKDTPIKNVSLRGLAISVTTVPLIAGRFGAAMFDGAVSLEHAENCVLDGLTVFNVAGHAINAKGQCVGIRVENSEIGPCGAGGVYVGGTKALINNNHVHGVGLLYPSAIGIFRGGKECVVSHNEVHDCSYSAINYGGEANRIEDNLICDCMKVLHDGAAIYLFGAKNCIVRRNFARDIADTGGYGASAYYLDEQSEDCVVEANLSVRVGWPTHNHMARRNTIRNNVFIVDGDAKLTFPRSSDYTVERNVVFATGKIRVEGVNAVTTWKQNLFYSGANKIEGAQLKDYTAAGAIVGAIADTVVADPQFVDWAKGDYRYRPDSPARQLGLQPIDISHVGRITK